MCPHCMLGTLKTVLLSTAAITVGYVWVSSKIVSIALTWRR